MSILPKTIPIPGNRYNRIMPSRFVQDFFDFIREQGAIGLAVGFVLGAAVKDVVNAFVNDIVNPLLGLMLGKAEVLRKASFRISTAEIKWGDFLATTIDFIIIAVFVYYFVKILKINRLDKAK